jgi:hypothetical protein
VFGDKSRKKYTSQAFLYTTYLRPAQKIMSMGAGHTNGTKQVKHCGQRLPTRNAKIIWFM